MYVYIAPTIHYIHSLPTFVMVPENRHQVLRSHNLICLHRERVIISCRVGLSRQVQGWCHQVKSTPDTTIGIFWMRTLRSVCD